MAARVSLRWDIATAAYCALLIVIAPYTKVEESFNVQATHDLLEFGPGHLAAFDHLQFPGVVPRTFIGALFISELCRPVYAVLRAFGATPLVGLYLVRLMLMLLNVAALGVLRRALAHRFPSLPCVADSFSMLLCTQFHLPFYLSRPLPNSLALPLCTLASAAYLRHRGGLCVWLLAFASAVLRCDCILLAAPMLLVLLARRHIPVLSMIEHGLAASVIAIVCSVLVDSYFWQRWLWPEGVVFFFNTVENKSAEWGTSPFHWYLSSAIPRILLPGALVWWLPRALLESKPAELRQQTAAATAGSRSINSERLLSRLDHDAAWMVLPGTVFVALYSLLPHKEVRFLFPAIPLFIAGAAVGLAKVRRDHSVAAPWSWRLARVVLLGHMALVFGFAAASAHNYPGAHALSLVHRHAATSAVPDSGAVDATAPLPVVHIGNLAATSGVSRFGEDRARFQYSKIEHLSPADLAAHPMHFAWAISEACASGDSGGSGGPSNAIPPGFELLEHVEAFRGMQARWPFLRLERSMCVLKRGVS